MSEPWPIPSSWRWGTMGEIAEVVGGGTPKTDHLDYYGGDIPWITPADLSGYREKYISHGRRSITQAGLDNSGARLMPVGTVLFSSRAPIGYVAIAANPVSTNQGFKSFVLGASLLPDFVYYYLQHARGLAIDLASGTTFFEISGKKAAQIPIPIIPLDEQYRIVAEIEKQFTRLESGVAALQRVQANLKRYRTAVLKAACEGRLVPTEAELARQGGRSHETGAQLLARILDERRAAWERQLGQKKKYTEPQAPDTDQLPMLPEGWVWVYLQTLVSFKNGINFSAEQKGETGILTVDVLNMYPCGIHVELSNLYHVNLIPDEQYILREGDILFVRSSVKREGVGYACLFKNASEPVTFCGFLIRARLNNSDISSRYLTHFFRSTFSREKIIKSSSQVTITNISQKALGLLPVPLPPIPEQHRIVAEVERRLSVIEELEAVVKTNLQRAQRLRQSILQQAFSGKLVNTNITDNADKKAEQFELPLVIPA